MLVVCYPWRNSWRWKKTLIDENENVIASIGLLDLEDDNNRF
jgi:hypothetical protein